MRAIARLLVVVFVALVGIVPLTVTYTLATAVQLLATTALIMGGTDHPLSTPPDTVDFVVAYMDDAVDNYIDPDPDPATDPAINRVAVIYPAEFFPVFGSRTFDDSVNVGRINLNSCIRGGACNFNDEIPESEAPKAGDTFIVFGYSQSAVIASLVKRDLIDDYGEDPTVPQTAGFFLAANPMRPNGGILARGFEGLTIPLIGITFHGPTPTDSPQNSDGTYVYPTTDVAQQYDLLGGDAPADVVNVLAWANSLAAYYYLHAQVPSQSLDDPDIIDQGSHGDTHYYLVPAERLPLLMPLQQLGVPEPILAVVDAPLRVLVEASYVRNVSPGEHVQLSLLPSANPIAVAVYFVRAIPVGIDDGLQEAGLGRALGTEPAGAFGVGGDDEGGVLGDSPLTVDPTPAALTEARGQAPQPPSSGQPAGGQAADDGQPGTPPAEQETGTPDAEELQQLIRGPIEFDRPKLSADRPPGDRPLQRVVRALTGQRPDPVGGEDGENEADGDESAGDNNEAA